MEAFLRAITADAVRSMTPRREGERKLGETIRTLQPDAGLAEGLRALPEAGFALLLVPEDIGVRANFGRAGAAALPQAALRRLLAMQDNPGLRGERLVLAGEVAVQDLMQQAIGLDPNRPGDLPRLHALVSEVDARVTSAVCAITSAGRTAIVLGGGHANAFGVLAGVHAGTGAAAGCVNLDAHADLRADAGRHSGNPFSKALAVGHLRKYAAIGLHEPYLNEHMWNLLASDARLLGITLESVLRGETSLDQACDRALAHVAAGPATLEVDLDAVAGVPASAATPSGLSAESLRRCVHQLASRLDARALHVCEGIPGDGDPAGVGKLAAMVVCDFVKARLGAAR
jgi:formiminoglutamase